MTDYDYYEPATPWKYKGISKAVFEGNATSIGSYAFAECGITSIIIPDCWYYRQDDSDVWQMRWMLW